MKCPNCGNNKFLATQRCVVNVPVIVDEKGTFLENTSTDWSQHCYDADEPEGPLECTQCKKEVKN